MPAHLRPVFEKAFVLEETDRLLNNDEEPTIVRVSQATQEEHAKRMELWQDFTRTYEPDGRVTVNQSISPEEVKFTEVLLTLKACNLQDEHGEQFFKFPLTADGFRRRWNQLPPMIADEIHSMTLKVNPTWSGQPWEFNYDEVDDIDID